MAQPNQTRWNKNDREKDQRNVVYKNNNSRMSDRDVMIRLVNRKYDSKIYQVKHNRYMKNRQKKRAIKDLEQNRQREFRQIYAKYDNRNTKYQRGKEE